MVGSIQAASNLRTQSAKGVRLAAIERREGGATKSASRNNIASIARQTKEAMVDIPSDMVAFGKCPTETPQKPREQTRINALGQKGKTLSLFDLFGRVLRS